METILFLDIETVPAYATYAELPECMRKCWDKKANVLKKNDEDTPESLYQRAGIYAEYGKIVCISVAYIRKDKLRIKSFYGENEKDVLNDFADLLNRYFNASQHYLCAHNGKEFDFPYLCRRMLIHKIPLPFLLNVSGKKPWETAFLDTMDMWRFGDYKNYTSLEVLALLFNIDTPKDDLDGSMVAQTYWEHHDLERIKTYCEKDVLTIVQLYLSYQAKDLLKKEDIIYK
ncbi:MAG: 3'-5' exonuclease [Bacteroidales bacterium]|jgi:DNA polymerase elongation subunit (family B)|nr:3'-5' exonuclease [Bacteroidales bacterium]MDD3330410.1 3'-5' exonuclease [Bacteroidales bacterium]MDD3691450.1 3'-5' exonuclease [Bacteroidales bacterium]MDD4044833.1 3'-5' exonuclease [Bacteroidales bacterium]MDD4581948.1 3'-5' exonuclease [Bacteroidales bacterium]